MTTALFSVVHDSLFVQIEAVAEDAEDVCLRNPYVLAGYIGQIMQMNANGGGWAFETGVHGRMHSDGTITIRVVEKHADGGKELAHGLSSIVRRLKSGQVDVLMSDEYKREVSKRWPNYFGPVK